MEPLSREAIERALAGLPLVRQVVYLPVASSTNDVARALARERAPEASLVVADEQTSGRGRLGRAWWAPPGACLLLSLLVRPRLPPRRALRLTMIAGLAAAEAIERVTPLSARLKWPNDIWLNGKKAGGILTETALTGDALDYAVVGIGLNVNVDFAGQAELAGLATSLMTEAGQPVDRLTVLCALLDRFAAWYAEAASPRLTAAWAERLITLRQRVRVQADTYTLEGLAEAVDDDGGLVVRADDGALHKVYAGDVSLRHHPI